MVLANTILEIEYEPGASGGPTFETRIKQHENGQETRFRVRTISRQRWNLGYGIAANTILLENVRAIFYAGFGRWDTFLVRDWSDYLITAGTIGTGDGIETLYQVVRQYITTGGQIHERTLKRLDLTTLNVYVDGVLQTITTHYTVDTAGLITFVTPPADTLVVTVDVEFYFLARLDIDDFQAVIVTADAGEMPDIPIIEVLE